MTAAECVALARKAAPWIIAGRWKVMGKAVGIVEPSGEMLVVRHDDVNAYVKALMRVELTAEMKDPERLARALLRSAISTVRDDIDGTWHAQFKPDLDWDGGGWTEQEAVDALLDSLLAIDAVGSPA